MRETKFGNINKRELCLRWQVPWVMTRWDGESRLVWHRLLNPFRWFRAVFSKWNWKFRFCRHKGSQHRCYCSDGSLCDGMIVLAGFGVSWFYSKYTGSIPCACDRVLAELDY